MTEGEKTNPIGKQNNASLIDSHSRQIDYLRISLTQKCNHACFFCHHEGESGNGSEMTVDEIERLVRVANQRGVKKIKLTGGETLVRDDIVEIVHRLAPLSDDLSITTNGSKLEKMASQLMEAGLNRINVSLHTLKPEVHNKITGRNNIESVKKGIEAAIQVGLNPVKINMAVLNGLNVDEIPDLMEYAVRVGAILQLIELQVISDEDEWAQYWVDLTNIEANLSSRAVQTTQRSLHGRKQYTIPVADTTVKVEVVKPNHNQSFCQRCTRLRVTSEGKLKPCLLRQDNLVEVHTPLGNESLDELVNDALERAVRAREPFWKGDAE